jgi:hypothetical protein
MIGDASAEKDDATIMIALQRTSDLLEQARIKLQQLGQKDLDSDALRCKRVKEVVADDQAVRLVLLAAVRGLRHCLFRRCPVSYYSWTLEQRRQFLEPAPTVYHLCKSLVLENIRRVGQEEPELEASVPPYILVVLPYPARLHADKVTQVVRSSPELCRSFPVSRSQVRYQVATTETCEQLTGYGYNAVTPLGLRATMPIIVASVLVSWLRHAQDDFFWLGGGAPDLKLNVSLKEFVETFTQVSRSPVLIRDVTY